ncbi:flagellar export protein FliJ [Gorillibacterium sp. sgz5001074]|uniref:flagellar export protein FliJ n=1 Tax=Gorillibacterium sp. sgz5001074 TaxID=3446695 RepID=UPI003F67D742
MRFRYSFQKIVDLKTNEKTQAEWILSGAVVKLREEESSLTSLFSEKDEIRERMHVTAEDRTTASELMSYQSYLNHLDDRIKRKAADVRHAEVNVVEKREVLSSKMVEEKVWNQARDKAFRQYQALMLKKEQEMLDELASNRYKRTM